MKALPSSQFSAFLERVRRHPPGFESAPLDELRRRFDATSPPCGDDVRIRPDVIAGRDAEWLTVDGSLARRLVVYLHGGGYVMGSLQSHRKLAGDIARASRSTVLLVDYPLAPEHPFPSAVDHVHGVLDELALTGISMDHVVLAGDSAGGGLALAALIRLRDLDAPRPAAAVTISAFLRLDSDLVYTRAAIESDPIVTPGTVALVRSWYFGEQPVAERDRSIAAVTSADLTGLPPLLVLVGSAELLADDSRLLAERATACGVPVTLEIWPHMTHVWPALAGWVPEATEAVERVAEFIRSSLSDIDVDVSSG